MQFCQFFTAPFVFLDNRHIQSKVSHRQHPETRARLGDQVQPSYRRGIGALVGDDDRGEGVEMGDQTEDHRVGEVLGRRKYRTLAL